MDLTQQRNHEWTFTASVVDSDDPVTVLVRQVDATTYDLYMPRAAFPYARLHHVNRAEALLGLIATS